MPVDKLKLSQALRQLDKELLNSKKLLEARKDLENSLHVVFAQIDFIEKQSDQDAVFTQYFKELSNSRELIAKFKELERSITELNKILQELEPARVRADLFFENFRDYRNYYFQESAKAFEFIRQAFETYNLERAFFKPQFLGMNNLNSMIDQFSLTKEKNQSLRVSKEKLPDLLNYLQANGLLRKSRLDNETIKILFNTPNELFIEAENSKIRRLDQIAKQLGGEPWDS
ncbi:MAG: hypothetical protein Q7R70_06075 [Candidatus Diapherotrites archaeon]|nr:hypothetical protein [Candidatus Diapherotrites archaeon]